MTSTSKWKPKVTLDFIESGPAVFKNVQRQFYDWADTQPDVVNEPLPIKTGWNDITPQLAENLLRRNKGNRRANYQTVYGYAVQMVNGEWKKTGQPLLFTDIGILLDGQQRLWGCYLSGKTCCIYVITDIPHEDSLFAYIDNVRARTGADALEIAGYDDLGQRLNNVVKLAVAFDRGLSLRGGATGHPPLSNREVLGYVQNNPGIADAVRYTLGEFKEAVQVIDDPTVAALFGWKVTEFYGQEVLDDFMEHLVTKGLPNDDPVYMLQKRLDLHHKAKLLSKAVLKKKQDFLQKQDILGFLIMAFNFWRSDARGKKLSLSLNENFPSFDDEVSEAA